MRLIGVDPGSNRTGYAVMDSPTEFIEAGHVGPVRKRDSMLDRVATMIDELGEVVQQFSPDQALIEIPSGKVAGRLSGRSHGAGLSVYGFAAGAIWHGLRGFMGEDHVRCATELEWTGSVPKSRRRALIAAAFPAYRQNTSTDPGGDASDAIGLCVWWFAGLQCLAAGRHTASWDEPCKFAPLNDVVKVVNRVEALPEGLEPRKR